MLLNHTFLLDLDCNIARPKIPKTALPPEIRAKLGFNNSPASVPYDRYKTLQKRGRISRRKVDNTLNLKLKINWSTCDEGNAN